MERPSSGQGTDENSLDAGAQNHCGNQRVWFKEIKVIDNGVVWPQMTPNGCCQAYHQQNQNS